MPSYHFEVPVFPALTGSEQSSCAPLKVREGKGEHKEGKYSRGEGAETEEYCSWLRIMDQWSECATPWVETCAEMDKHGVFCS